MTRRAIFLDRDGTICEEVGYLDRPERLVLIDGAATAIQRANGAGLWTVVVTNQAGVAHGHLDEPLLWEIHDRLRELLDDGGARLDGIYYCPHHPEAAVERYRRSCTCRKPEPGMLHRARDEMGIDLASSYIVGDRYRDIATGRAVGATGLLVRTGHAGKEVEYSSGGGTDPTHVEDDLTRAVDWIVRQETAASEVSQR